MPRTVHWDPPRTPFQARHVAALGVTRRVLERALAQGRIVRLAAGTYVAAEAVPTDAVERHLLTARALQMQLPRAVASHHTAALAWALELDDPAAAAAAPARFIEPAEHRTRARSSPAFAIAVRDLPPSQRVAHPSGLIVTSRDRAALDVAAALPLPQALITLDSAARMNLRERAGRAWLRDEYLLPRSLVAATRPLTSAAERAATQRSRGPLSAALRHVDPRRESPAESLAYGYIVLAGLPLPELQARFTDEQGDVFTDFLWAKAMLVCEIDGNVKYRTQEDLVAERRRDARLRALGLRLHHVEAGLVRRRPGEFVAGLARLLCA